MCGTFPILSNYWIEAEIKVKNANNSNCYCYSGSLEIAQFASAWMEPSGLKMSRLTAATLVAVSISLFSQPLSALSYHKGHPSFSSSPLRHLRIPSPLGRCFVLFVLRWLYISISPSIFCRTLVLQDGECISKKLFLLLSSSNKSGKYWIKER